LLVGQKIGWESSKKGMEYFAVWVAASCFSGGFIALERDTVAPERSSAKQRPKTALCMPTYEYQCEKCKRGFEFFQSMKDAPLAVCPKEACQMKKWGKGKVRRQLGTGAGLIFKGSGFYITDYRSESYKAGAKGESSSSSGGGDSGAAKSSGAESATNKAAKPASESKSSKKNA
jgi:putative FmdB family regulatory protein